MSLLVLFSDWNNKSPRLLDGGFYYDQEISDLTFSYPVL